MLAVSKHIELDSPLIINGRPDGLDGTVIRDLARLFPTTFGVDIYPPFLVIRVHTLPPKPWPFTIGGMPVHFTTDIHDSGFDRGKLGKGPKAVTHINLQNEHEFSDEVLDQAISLFRDLGINIQSIFWLGTFWQVTVIDYTDMKTLPCMIAGHLAYYKFGADVVFPDSAALRKKAPQGVEYDDTLYATSPNSLLRPGIMLSSSIIHDETGDSFKTTTSGLLVADQHSEFYITVATHGFEADGLVYHPNPHEGIVIGHIVANLPGTDISLAKLVPGLRYVNETFGTIENPAGQIVNGMSTGRPPWLHIGDMLWMNNPFSGGCEGSVLALGALIPGNGDHEHVPHQWLLLENGDAPVDGSCGTAIVDKNRQVVGLFRYKHLECYATSAVSLRKYGYEICGGEQTF